VLSSIALAEVSKQSAIRTRGDWNLSRDLRISQRSLRFATTPSNPCDSRYEAGKRSGAWSKYRLNSAQELVIGGYVPGPRGVDSIIVGYYEESELIYVARVRAGFVPATRRQVFAKLQPFHVLT
jgi:hypothetical protein